jgi:hypothetical protein
MSSLGLPPSAESACKQSRSRCCQSDQGRFWHHHDIALRESEPEFVEPRGGGVTAVFADACLATDGQIRQVGEIKREICFGGDGGEGGIDIGQCGIGIPYMQRNGVGERLGTEINLYCDKVGCSNGCFEPGTAGLDTINVKADRAVVESETHTEGIGIQGNIVPDIRGEAEQDRPGTDVLSGTYQSTVPEFTVIIVGIGDRVENVGGEGAINSPSGSVGMIDIAGGGSALEKGMCEAASLHSYTGGGERCAVGPGTGKSDDGRSCVLSVEASIASAHASGSAVRSACTVGRGGEAIRSKWGCHDRMSAQTKESGQGEACQCVSERRVEGRRRFHGCWKFGTAAWELSLPMRVIKLPICDTRH